MLEGHPSGGAPVILQISRTIYFSMDDSLAGYIVFGVLAFRSPNLVLLKSELGVEFVDI